MGPLERVRKLEEVRQRRHVADTEEDLLLERRAALRASMQRARLLAEAEAAAGDSRRLRAVEELEARMWERVRRRRRQDES